MPALGENYDAIVIGGGFYGVTIASYLSKQRGLHNIALIEREESLMSRASYHNQARIHNGYHYPRSFTTAYRSRINLPKFITEWPSAVKDDFVNLYAIARRNSKVTYRQFERFCKEIGADYQPASQALKSLFEPRLIEQVYLSKEHVFDACILAQLANQELVENKVHINLESTVTGIFKQDGMLVTRLMTAQGSEETLSSRYVFNCTYSGLNQLAGDFLPTATQLKQEITELALIKLPPTLANLGITVMDGPFFSIMPFPARKLHSLSHVRYTPHQDWIDEPGIDPYQKLDEYNRSTRVNRMIRDVSRYLPGIIDAQYTESLFEVKTVLLKNENDDGRPILFEKHPGLPGCYSILGGKIDNIYDVLEKLDGEQFDQTAPSN